MGERSKIEWTDHTFNPWIGCTKVSPGCDHCYAERLSVRWRAGWGHGEPRKRTSESTWKLPGRWDRRCAKEGKRERVFCASLADVFDNEVSDDWRRELFTMIGETPNLDWLILTKRPELARRWWDKELLNDIIPNVWLGTSVENQEMAKLRIPILLDIPADIHFLSVEPMLGPVNLRWLASMDVGHGMLRGVQMIDWVICGGESGPKARMMSTEWARDLRDQCMEYNIEFFMKQMTSKAPIPHDLVVREFPL